MCNPLNITQDVHIYTQCMPFFRKQDHVVLAACDLVFFLLSSLLWITVFINEEHHH